MEMEKVVYRLAWAYRLFHACMYYLCYYIVYDTDSHTWHLHIKAYLNLFNLISKVYAQVDEWIDLGRHVCRLPCRKERKYASKQCCACAYAHASLQLHDELAGVDWGPDG